MINGVTPLFSTSASLEQGGIFTVEKAGEKQKLGRKTGPVSLCDLAKEEGLKEIVMVESNFINFMQASKNLDSIGVQFKFGLKLVVCEDINDKTESSFKTESKVVIFMASDSAYSSLIKIYSKASTDGFYNIPRIDWKTLNQMWSDDLILAFPFYSSFLARNTLSFATILPDLPTKPILFWERQFLPFDDIIKEAVVKYATTEKIDIQAVKSVYYKNRSDAKSWMVYQCILRRSSWDKPNIDHCTSREFCWEAYKEIK